MARDVARMDVMPGLPAALSIELLSDTTPGRGEGLAGLVDQDVVHDRDGFPYLPGRTIKGLLSEAGDDLIATLPREVQAGWRAVARDLYGRPGSGYDGAALHVDDALLPGPLRRGVAPQVRAWRAAQEQEAAPPAEALAPEDVLGALTTIRRQTAVDALSGAPEDRSLRALRLVVRGLVFCAVLTFERAPGLAALALLDASALGLQRLGQGRNRGRGRVRCTLLDGTSARLSGLYAGPLLDGGPVEALQ